MFRYDFINVENKVLSRPMKNVLLVTLTKNDTLIRMKR